MSGKLYLIPSTIGDTLVEKVIPEYIRELINDIRYFIVEEERTARRMLIKLGIKTPIDDLTFFVLNKHTNPADLPGFLDSANDSPVGLLSEAGVPAIADPGSEIVMIAHEREMEIIPLVGPSSILLAMMASGLNGQNFAFNGYLPIQPNERIRKIKMLEQRSGSENQSQLFIETPYRNNQLLKDILQTCNENTLLCIAADITSDNAFIRTYPIYLWRKKTIDLNKRPAIFILHKK
jgi:16S rRNA (cytidine1402-2'-O)-methyltransferase